MNEVITIPKSPSVGSANNLRPAVLFPLFSPTTSLSGVGEKTAEALQRLAGSRLRDLVFHAPSGLIDRRAMPPLSACADGMIITAKIQVDEYLAPPSRHRSSKKPFRVMCSNETGSITLVFFKTYPEYIEKFLPLGEERIISGKVERNYGTLQMTHPDHIVPVSQQETIQKIEPVYPLTYGLLHKNLVKTIQSALTRLPDLSEWIDPFFIKQQQWQDWRSSLQALHHPQSASDLLPEGPILSRLAYDELFASQLALQLIRKKLKSPKGQTVDGDKTLQHKLRNNLGFTLTAGQEQSIKEIQEDQASPNRMMRLLQGDVGSGKTAVALFAMLNAVECGRQAALMAPTEILARQHMAWIQKVTENLGITVTLLTGRTPAKERKQILESLASGDVNIIIGTHALFQGTVAFNDLGLAVIDEQHRFGVDQRLALANKGNRVDMLLMTATPIPRTLTMTLYGDMDVSRLTDKPAGRQPIDTRIISLSKMEDIMDGIARAVANGTKLYWICPLVEESEVIDLAAAQDRYDMFVSHFGDKVGLVHGKMPAEERDPVMLDFRNSNKQILVATTVVEVGVDVPDATLIVIEHAERFGLSQLHQLRGRVGRGNQRSTCLLLYDPKTTGSVGRARLNIMRETEDGFRIAEEDLRLRGSGEILGTKQSGLPGFTFTNLEVHSSLLGAAHDDARLLLNKDPSLESERGKAARLLLYLFEYDQQMKYLKSG